MYRTLVLALLSWCVLSEAEAATPDQAALSWAAFECATFAEHSGERAQQERLFNLGLASGREFIVAMQRHEFTDEQVNNSAPVGFLLSLGGPSVDFMLGVVFAHASQHGFERITERAGQRLDRELMQVVAGNLFRENNCALLR